MDAIILTNVIIGLVNNLNHLWVSFWGAIEEDYLGGMFEHL